MLVPGFSPDKLTWGACQVHKYTPKFSLYQFGINAGAIPCIAELYKRKEHRNALHYRS